MVKKDNTIYWILGVIVVLVILVGGFGIFNTEKSKCQREGGIYVKSPVNATMYRERKV